MIDIDPKNTDETLTLLSTEIIGIDASNILSKKRPGGSVMTNDFTVGFQYENKPIISKPIGVETSNISIESKDVNGCVNDIARLIMELSTASQEIDIEFGNASENKFPRYLISNDLLMNGVLSDPRVFVSRADTFVTLEEYSTNLRVIEINAKCPEAQGWAAELSRRINQRPTLGPIGITTAEISKQVGRNMAVVVWPNDVVKGNETLHITNELTILKELNIIDNFLVAAPDDVTVDSGRVRVDGVKVDWIYRYFGPDDVLYANSYLPDKNGVTRPDKHAELEELNIYDNYGRNSTLRFGDYNLHIAGVMWTLLREGLNGRTVVFPDAPSAKLGYKGLFPRAYSGKSVQISNNLRLAQKLLTPSFNLSDCTHLPETSVLKLTNSSGGADVIVGSSDTKAVVHALSAHGNVNTNEKFVSDNWKQLIHLLKQKPNGWIVQPQVKPGNFDLLSNDDFQGSKEIPYDLDPYVVVIDNNTYIGPCVLRYKSIDPQEGNNRINVVQGGKFSVVNI